VLFLHLLTLQFHLADFLLLAILETFFVYLNQVGQQTALLQNDKDALMTSTTHE